MSAAKMVADSTQGDSTTDNKKRKKKTKKSVMAKNKVVLPEDEDSDLDLKKDLHPIGFYLKDRCTMIEEMFHCVRGASLQRALPELLKSMPIDELKELCLEQLEVMSNKRLQRILGGEESANISSSGTDDMDDDDEEEDVESSEDDFPGGIHGDGGGVDHDNVNMANIQKKESEGPELAADSTSTVVNNDEPVPSQNTETKQDSNDDSNKDKTDQTQSQSPPIEEVYIKQEPPDSDPEQRHERSYRSRHRSESSQSRSRSRSRSSSSSSGGSSYRRRRRRRRSSRRRRRGSSSSSSSRSRSSTSCESEKASLIVGGYEEAPEAYTSGSEDGELVRKEVVTSVTVKQEVMSEGEDGGQYNKGNVETPEVNETETLGNSGNDNDGGGVPSEKDPVDIAQTSGEVVNKDGENNTDVGSGDESKESDSDVLGGVDESSDNVGAGRNVVEEDSVRENTVSTPPHSPPSKVMDQMELLELEMRARAIKAMLMTSSQGEEGKTDGI